MKISKKQCKSVKPGETQEKDKARSFDTWKLKRLLIKNLVMIIQNMKVKQSKERKSHKNGKEIINFLKLEYLAINKWNFPKCITYFECNSRN